MAISIDIPGGKNLRIRHIVLDFNGTLAVDGRLLSAVIPLLIKLSEQVKIHVVTADTFKTAVSTFEKLPVHLVVLKNEKQHIAKARYVENLDASSVIAIGNGFNDHLMLQKAALGIAVILEEGVASKTLLSSDMICRNIDDALMLILNSHRLIAGLRS